MDQVTQYHQGVGFHFNVSFLGLGKEDIDGRFQSVSGLEVSFETETIKEGGENQFEHVIPARRKYNDLVLKRGILSPNAASRLTNWCKNAFDNFKFEPINLDIDLLDDNHNPLFYWQICHAWPKAWKVGELNAEKSEVLIETFELNYNRYTFTKNRR